MFPYDKSIGGPPDFPSYFPTFLEAQHSAANDGKTFPAKAVTDGFSSFDRGKQRFKGLPRQVIFFAEF
jgi:hypothetical protein